ncbi:HEPN domain-containing protein [Acidithiobacillus ferriphilus]|uniref:ApeA N-terminal domain 1-containing protein n=1 Tax=Acidithiobacillus ferriphilus TaxID=1689834 RepID=UPI001C06983D|nr:HEPN domain-containing protein [Acidithiobacillus ferriphilus]MBU2831873.1 hypothetical protein [Acidithiobacillus ferriphilus]
MAKKNMTMVEPFERNGIWWMPGQDNRVPGTLIFDPKNGVAVTLFQPIDVEFAKKDYSASKLIHGIVDGGLKISLLDCYEVLGGTTFSGNGVYSNGKIVARQCVTGAHLCNDSKFNKFLFAMHNYTQFMCRTGMRPATNHDAGFVWDRVNPVAFEIDGDKINLGIGVQAPFSIFEFTASIKENVSISITTKSPAGDLDEAILGVFHSLKTMLEFSLGYPVPIVQFKAVATDACGQDEKIEIFFSQSGYDTQKIGGPHQDMLFSFCGLTDENVPDFVRAWHDFYNKNRFTIDVVINSGVKSSGAKRPEQSFFFLISSLEALQRSYGETKVSMSADEFIKIKKSIFDVLPENDFGGHMRNRIGNMNDPSLRQRLGDVLDAMPQSVAGRIISKKVLLDNLINTRTLLAHHIDRPETNNDVLHIWNLTNVLWGITVIYMLGLLGFSSDQIDGIVKNKINMLNALHWIEEVSSKPSNKS